MTGAGDEESTALRQIDAAGRKKLAKRIQRLLEGPPDKNKRKAASRGGTASKGGAKKGDEQLYADVKLSDASTRHREDFRSS